MITLVIDCLQGHYWFSLLVSTFLNCLENVLRLSFRFVSRLLLLFSCFTCGSHADPLSQHGSSIFFYARFWVSWGTEILSYDKFGFLESLKSDLMKVGVGAEKGGQEPRLFKWFLVVLQHLEVI